MINEAQICLTGYVATQPVTRTLLSGADVAEMRVAWTPRWQDRATAEWVDGHTSYATVICWRTLALNVGMCIRKGDPVVVKGRLTIRPFTDKEGAHRTAVEVEASSVGHDLNKGVSKFSRIRPRTGMTASEFAAAKEAGDNGDDEKQAGTWTAGEAELSVPSDPDDPFFNEAAINEVTETDPELEPAGAAL